MTYHGAQILGQMTHASPAAVAPDVTFLIQPMDRTLAFSILLESMSLTAFRRIKNEITFPLRRALEHGRDFKTEASRSVKLHRSLVRKVGLDMKQFVLAFGNFFFKWRDAAFSLIFIGAFFTAGMVALNPDGFEFDLYASILGLLLAAMGQFVRAITIGYAYIKRGGLNKKIYAETLQDKGVFAHTRNPMYLGNLLLVTGAIVCINNLVFYLLVLPLFYFIYYSIIAAEEDFLSRKFGTAYDTYKEAVPNRLFPGNMGKWNETVKEMEFSWKRLIRKEHGSTVVIFGGLCLYNVTKFHLRYDIPFLKLNGLWIAFALLAIFEIVSEILKRTGHLAENN